MSMYEDVKEFHKKFGHTINDTPTVPDFKTKTLRRRLILEEVYELIHGMDEDDLELIADGAADAIYVILGTLIAYGIDLKPIWDEVQRANMSKSTKKDAFGKTIKPKNFVPPDVKGKLREQGADL